MKREKVLPLLVCGMLAAFFAVLLIQGHAVAEIEYPVPAYQGDGLAKVREWEESWAGKKITPANIDEVKELLPENLSGVIKDTGKWGESWFEIIPYKMYEPTKAEIKFTKEGACTIDADENMQGYVSGIPFPNPKTGLEIVYNVDNFNSGDNDFDLATGPVTDGRRGYDRTLEVDEYQMWFSGRRETPPVPAVTPNPKDMYHAYHVQYHFPVQLKGTRALTIRWNDRSRDYGSWEFSSGTRRVVRRSTAQRQTHVSISDFTYNDQKIWNWVVNANTYKLLGKKELLVGRHQEDAQVLFDNHTEGKCLPNAVKRERMNLYALDVVNKDPNYLYSKEVWYVDPESWLILYADKYDKQGRLWKIMEIYLREITSESSGEKIHMLSSQYGLDVPRMHSTLMLFTGLRAGITDDPEHYSIDYYSPKALLKYGY